MKQEELPKIMDFTWNANRNMVILKHGNILQICLIIFLLHV